MTCILGLIIFLAGNYIIYVSFCILYIPDDKFTRYKNLLLDVKSTVKGESDIGVVKGYARNSKTGKLINKGMISVTETKNLFEV